MRGRKPVPSKLVELHGVPSRRKPKAMEPKPVGDLSNAPDWLSETQQAGWLYALQHAPSGLLKRLDRGALVVWAVAEDLHRQAVIAQTKIGGLVSKLKGTQTFIQSPYLPIINRQALIMLKAASELGFTPVSRPRIFAAGSAPGEGLHGDQTTPANGTLDDFLATNPDKPPTIN